MSDKAKVLRGEKLLRAEIERLRDEVREWKMIAHEHEREAVRLGNALDRVKSRHRLLSEAVAEHLGLHAFEADHATGDELADMLRRGRRAAA